jgi:uncharacterized protein (DUF1015 family)
MVAFLPFRGWRYNPDIVSDMASVLCPPYDLIAPELKVSLHKLSRYNAVNLEGAERPDDKNSVTSHYDKAASTFDEWRLKGVLLREHQPCFYLLRHGFKFRGQAKARLSLFGCMRLEEYEKRKILPHEYTKDLAINDRISLMATCKANFSAILSLYRDARGLLAPTFDQTLSSNPIVETQDGPDNTLTLWRIDNPKHIQHIGDFFKDRPAYIADGHHRYEAALKFRAIQLARSNGPTNTYSAFNFALMALTDFDDLGLVVLPFHRILGGLPAKTLALVIERLHRIFDITPIGDLTNHGSELLVNQMELQGKDHQVLGLIGPIGECHRLLSLKHEVGRNDWGPLAVSEAWILEEQVLKPVLGSTLKNYLSYGHDHNLAIKQVYSGQQQMAFLLNPLSMTSFETLIGNNLRLPPKSTFFHPKLPTGLLFNQLSGSVKFK